MTPEEIWQQTSKKKFERCVENNMALCFDDLGANRYATYYNISNRPVARIDQSLGVYEINVA